MTITKLDLYNQALETILGERALASLTENRKPRRLLDGVWNRGAVNYCLGKAPFKFCIRSSRLDYDPSVTPDFGHNYAHELPSDNVQIWSICSDEFYRCPINSFENEKGFIFTSVTPIYIKYSSNHANYGNDFSKWTEEFQDFVAAYLAKSIAISVTQSERKAEAAAEAMKRAESKAIGSDGIASPALFFPPGRMAMARHGGTARPFERRS